MDRTAEASSVVTSLGRLSALATEIRQDPESATRGILALLAEALEAGATFVSRFTSETLHLEHTYDPAMMGLHDGADIPLTDTYCNTLFTTQIPSLIITNILDDPYYTTLATTHALHARAYSGVLLRRSDGTPYGTLCTLNPAPRVARPDEVALLTLAGQLIMQMVESHENEHRLRTLMEIAPIGAGISDEHGVFEMVNDAFTMLTGYHRDELIGRHFAFLYPAEDQTTRTYAYTERVAAAAHGRREERLLRKDGAQIIVQVDGTQMTGRDGRPRRIWYGTDITVQRERESRLIHDAYSDTLTGLPNRSLFHRWLSRAIVAAEEHGKHGAVLFVDLDGFKQINDTYGHDCGDRALRAVAERLQAQVRDSDRVARWGGDEFVVLLPTLTAEDAATEIASRLLAAMHDPIDTDDCLITLSTSIGIAFFAAISDADATITAADSAMYDAKRHSKGTYAIAGHDET